MKIPIYSILLAFLLIGINSTSLGDSSLNCNKHPLYCTILKLNPIVDPHRAMQISNAIAKYSKIYDIDAYRSLAIIAQENMFNDRDRMDSVVVSINNKFEIVEAATDIGICQFNVKTIKAYNIDIERFKTDLDYTIGWHFKLLKEKISNCKDLGKNAWGCYHSKTKDQFKKYIKDVNRWYNPLKFKKE